MIKELLETITNSDVKVDTKKGKVKVSITLAPRPLGQRKRCMTVTPARARRVLSLQGIAAGTLLSPPLTISNNDDATLQGTWEFALPDSDTAKDNAEPSSSSRRSRKTTSRAKPKASATTNDDAEVSNEKAAEGETEA